MSRSTSCGPRSPWAPRWAAALLVAGLILGSPARAIQVSAGPALHLRLTPPVVSQNNAAAARASSTTGTTGTTGSTSADAVVLIRGVVQAIDLSEGSLSVGGQRLRWDAARLRVVLPSGSAAGPAELRVGQSIRFAIDSAAGDGDGAKGRVVLIYVEAGR